MRVLMILTSHGTLGETGERTGLWLEEFAAPYYVLRDAGAEVLLASPAGGMPPIDPRSEAPEARTEATRRFRTDPQTQAALAQTRPLADVDASAVDALFYSGGHGPLWDLTTNPDSIRLIEACVRAHKLVAAICHGPAALLNARAADGTPLLAGKHATGFTNSEERTVGLADVVPFAVETEMTQRGCLFQATTDFAPHVIRDGLLITGQNPASSTAAAEALLTAWRGPVSPTGR